MWRWVSATALIAVGLVMGASVAGGQDAHTSWPELGHGSAAAPLPFHTDPGRFVTPLEPHVAGSSYAAESSNWSGQISTGTTYSGIHADWVVPTVQPTQYGGISATWIGIDGGLGSPNSIIQTGTQQETAGRSTLYAAWYELYPAAPVTVGGVSPGDSMSASITHDGGSNWTISIADVSTGNSDAIPVTYNGPADSAEWIEELPTVVGAAQPTLADFGSVTFTDMTYIPANPGAASLMPIDMVDESGNVIASAGPTSFNGVSSSFTDTYVPTGAGYWLVGSDGGIFSFGQAQFYGSTGSLHLQRPVVGIVPTANHGGYWLDASDGGVFSYGDTQYYGSIPGLGSASRPGRASRTASTRPLWAWCRRADDDGYFMVASDGGVFAFGDAHFAGSCPGIGGCSGAAVAVMPDASGNGYWLVTATGNVYTFGDAPYFGAPGPSGTVTRLFSTPDGLGYWILLADGQVFSYGDAAAAGSPPGGDSAG